MHAHIFVPLLQFSEVHPSVDETENWDSPFV